jgi:glycosyltransferase involved in cell wall biosynthesis
VKEKPRLIFVQNPSVVLALFIAIIGKIGRKPVIVDAHNIGIFFEHSSKLIQYIGQKLNNLVINAATLTLVTNCLLARFVEQKKGHSFILPDPLPKYQGYQPVNFKKRKNVFYICSFSVDEPYKEVIKAAEHIDQDINIFISGDYKRAILPANLPKNVVFTGYLTEKEYINYLFSSDVIVDLTTRENLLVCGAYEAIAAEKPLLLSNTATLRSYFLDGALYSDNVAIDIADNINDAFENLASLKKRAREIKDLKTKEWLTFKHELDNYLIKLLA